MVDFQTNYMQYVNNMDYQSKQELERLYELAKSATATTHFYNQVYKYII